MGTFKNVLLIDKKNIHNNRLQVINQYKVAGVRRNRYDVTILVNGLPLVHVELKRRGVAIREAFNQIERYQRDSFWAGSGLFQYVQVFVISNGTETKYYSNTTRDLHLGAKEGRRSKKQTSNSFAFTSWWADASNKTIRDLVHFTRTFFAKHTLLNVLSKYCVFDADRNLLVMRPYQIVATERILQRVDTSTNYNKLGTIAAGGYVWHTTGSGKTLTSFKTAQLASRMESVDKVLFVVDRKDLDYQTMREYDRFEKGAANSNTSTAKLKKQLEDEQARIIITTIQKLTRFVAQNPRHEIYSVRVVIVFDECHRSQFGDMHTAITKAFKRYHLFGFTGTPIFTENIGPAKNPKLRTTEQAFGDKLHAYTIIDAILDANVLPFRVDYHNTIGGTLDGPDELVEGINTEKAFLAPERTRQIVDYILAHFDQKTKQTGSPYKLGGRWMRGFNSLFATASIDAAKRYYLAFEEAQRAREETNPSCKRLNVALIFSYAANEDEPEGFIDDEGFQTGDLDQSSRDFLEDAIGDYNVMFATNYDTSADKFESYYKDLALRLRNREVDLAIVVNMFLTGFDATTLNTLWVDKSLRYHGLLQAFSRTNRILNSVKTFGNIVSFRNLEKATDDALTLFGNKDASGVVLLKPFSHYFSEYEACVADLLKDFPLDTTIVGEAKQKQFINLFGEILRLRNILTSFDEFAEQDTFTERDLQDYQSIYLDLYQDLRGQKESEKESIIDDLVFEIELIRSVDTTVDYILMLVQKHLAERHSRKAQQTRSAITRAIDSSPTLRNKKDLIEAFVDSLTVDADVDASWRRFVEVKRAEELDWIIADEGLKPHETREFIQNAFRDGAIPTTGTAITKIVPPVSRFSAAAAHAAKKQAVLDKLSAFFDRFYGLLPPTQP